MLHIAVTNRTIPRNRTHVGAKHPPDRAATSQPWTLAANGPSICAHANHSALWPWSPVHSLLDRHRLPSRSRMRRIPNGPEGDGTSARNVRPVVHPPVPRTSRRLCTTRLHHRHGRYAGGCSKLGYNRRREGRWSRRAWITVWFDATREERDGWHTGSCWRSRKRWRPRQASPLRA